MTEWLTEVLCLEPQYSGRGDAGDERLTLRQIEVSAKTRKDKRNATRYRYRYTFTVGDDGVATLATIERLNGDQARVSGPKMIRTLTAAEAAVSEWLTHEDPANLALQSTAARLELAAEDDAPPVTNEAREQEVAP